MFLPKLAKALGSCERAIVLQQIHWLSIQPQSGRDHDGQHWIYGTYEDWCRDYFSMWSPHTLAKHIRQLEKDGVLISAQLLAHQHDHTKFYRVNYDHITLQSMLPNAVGSMLPHPVASEVVIAPDVVGSILPDTVASIVPDAVDSIYGTETSTETSIQREEKGEDGTPSAPDGAPPLDDFTEELCAICYGHKETASLTEKDIGALRREGRRIRDAGYSVADLRLWMTRHWFADWRWQKGQQRPKPAEVRSSIPIVRQEPEVNSGNDGAASRRNYRPDEYADIIIG